MRPDWDEYFIELLQTIRTRSTCLRANHAAIIVRDNRIIATGYNGAPSGQLHCSDLKSCYRQVNNIPSGQQYEKCRALHAEQNAILQCAKFGISCKDSTIYITDVPCELCAKQILGAGIKNVVMATDSKRYCSNALHDLEISGGRVRFVKGKENGN